MRSYVTIAVALTISAYVIFTAIYWVIQGRRWRAERLRREKSPIEDQITAMVRIIRANASFIIEHLEEWDLPGTRRNSDGVFPLLDYYFRLEGMASSASHVISDWEQLAAEGDAFLDQGLKGFSGLAMAKEMVRLLRKRDQA